MPVISLLNQKGGVGKTTLSVHLAMALATDQKVLLVDADPQSSALDWSAQRDAQSAPVHFPVIGLPNGTLHRELAAISPDYEWIVIDGPPRGTKIARSAIVASDFVVIPVQPAPFDIWATEDVVSILSECEPIKPDLLTRFLINRSFPNTILSGEIRDALADYPHIQHFEVTIHNRQEYAKATRQGLTVLETSPQGPASAEIRAWVAEIVTALDAHAHQTTKKENLNDATGEVGSAPNQI